MAEKPEVTPDTARDWPIFVLTLAGDDKRRAPLEEALRRMRIPYELVFGIDGRKGLPAEYEDQIDRELTVRKLGRRMSDGEYACALSHRSIYQRILTRKLPGAIILEDDITLAPEFAAFQQNRDYLKASMILLWAGFSRAIRFSRIRTSHGALRRTATQCFGCAAYCINEATARLLVHSTSKISSVADWPICLHEAGAWLAVPRLAEHAPTSHATSHLEAERSKLGSSLLRKSDGFRPWLRQRLSARVGRERELR